MQLALAAAGPIVLVPPQHPTMKAKQFLLAGIGAVVALGLAACSTTEGFGRDLQKVGKRLEKRADSTGGTAPEKAAPSVPTPPPPPPPAAP